MILQGNMSLRAETNFPVGIYQGLAAPSPSMPPVFSFEFLVDTNTCGDRNVWSGSWRFTINQCKLLHQKKSLIMIQINHSLFFGLNIEARRSLTRVSTFIHFSPPFSFDVTGQLFFFFTDTSALMHLSVAGENVLHSTSNNLLHEFAEDFFDLKALCLKKKESSSSYIFGVIHFFLI